jgi:uncharacterized protein (TIGR02996 family)
MTEAALLAAILAHPDQDDPRLVYADWFDDNGEPDRSAFIRAQVELARRAGCKSCARQAVSGRAFSLTAPGPFLCRPCDALRRRERELWAPPLNRDLIRVAQSHGLATLVLPGEPHPDAPYRSWGVVRRGFPDEVRVETLSQWLGGPCGRCFVVNDGIGDVRRVGCNTCSGTGRTPGIGAEVVRRWPVTKCVVADREPTQNERFGWSWFRADNEQDPYRLRYELFRHLSDDADRGTEWVIGYPTRAAALDALSAALIRAAAKCPACEGRGKRAAGQSVLYPCLDCRGTGDVRGIQR